MLFLALILTVPLALLCKLYGKYIKPKKSIFGKHVCITGGSSGIGKSLAILAAKKGAHVTIIARDKERLEATIAEMEKNRIDHGQKFASQSLDCTRNDSVAELFNQVDTENPIFMLVCCIGMAFCGRFEDLTEADIRSQIDINYFATVFPIKAVIPKMKKREDGIIVMCGSQGGLFGVYGYSAYASAKFALRGFAECLNMELKDYKISITLALPPDTDTPGFETENKSKPKETRLISESAGLLSPDKVAKALLNDALDGQFFSYVGLESWILTTLCIGMTPVRYMFDAYLQVLFLGLLRFLSLFYLHSFYNIVTKCYLNKKIVKKD